MLEPSIDHEDLASDQIGGVTEQKDACIGNVLNETFASKGNV